MLHDEAFGEWNYLRSRWSQMSGPSEPQTGVWVVTGASLLVARSYECSSWHFLLATRTPNSSASLRS